MDLPKVSELEKLVKFCRKSGIKSLKSGDFSLELDAQALFPESNYKKKQEQTSELITPPIFTEDEALFWSSAGIPEEQGTN